MRSWRRFVRLFTFRKRCIFRRRMRDDHTEAIATVATRRRTAAAIRGKQTAGVDIAPRRPAQHTPRLARLVFVLAPLPHVTSHIVKPVFICGVLAYCRSPRRTVIITRYDAPALSRHSNTRFLTRITPCTPRWRPLLSPWIYSVYLCIFRLRHLARVLFLSDPDRAGPFVVARQPVTPILRQLTGTMLFVRKPLAKCYRVIPAHAHHRVLLSLT